MIWVLTALDRDGYISLISAWSSFDSANAAMESWKISEKDNSHYWIDFTAIQQVELDP